MQFESLSFEEQQEHLRLRTKACKNHDRKELSRLVKMFELDERVAKGILLTFGEEAVVEQKKQGYLFPRGY